MSKVTYKNFWNYLDDYNSVNMAYYVGNHNIDLRKVNSLLYIIGGNGNDTIYGSKSHMNFIYGDDYIEYLEESIYSNCKGNDIIYGGDKLDYIVCGKGNDKLYGNKGLNIFQFSAGDGADSIFGGKGNDYIYFIDRDIKDLILQRKNNDLIILYNSTFNGDSINIKDYFKGNSSLKGLLSNTMENFVQKLEKIDSSNEFQLNSSLTKLVETFCIKISDFINEKGLNIITSGKIIGTDADDTITSSKKNDKIYANDGDDYISSGSGKDTIYAGLGNDSIFSGSGNDKVYCESGNNVVDSGSGNDTIYCGVGDDTINAGKGNDRIYGNVGNSTFLFQKGDGLDKIYAAKSSDTIKIDESSSLNFRKSGNNLVIEYNSQLKKGKKIIKDSITLVDYFKTDERVLGIYYNGKYLNLSEQIINISGKGKIYGTDEDNIIKGSNKSDTIYTSGGDNIVYANKGNDKINLGDGENIVYGGKGKDTINVNGGRAILYFKNGDGNDTVNILKESNVELEMNNNISFRLKGDDLYIDRKYKSGKKTIVETLTLKNINDNIISNIKLNGKKLDEWLNSVKIIGKKVDGEYQYIGLENFANLINCTNNGKNYLFGGNKDDVYKLTLNNKSSFEIDDIGGDDILNINNKSGNVRLLFNVDSNGDIVVSDDYYKYGYECYWQNSLLLFEKSSLTLKNYYKLVNENAKGFVNLANYFLDNSNQIEHIQFKGNEYDIQNSIATISEEVGNWLNQNAKGMTAFEVLNKNDNSSKELLNVFFNNDIEK